jgi:hypothetical protein
MTASDFKQEAKKPCEVADAPDFLQLWVGAESVHQDTDQRHKQTEINNHFVTTFRSPTAATSG